MSDDFKTASEIENECGIFRKHLRELADAGIIRSQEERTEIVRVKYSLADVKRYQECRRNGK